MNVHVHLKRILLNVYLKRLIKSCVGLVGARYMPTTSGHVEVMQDQRQRCSISLHDFKVAMELNPQQLGEDWPLLLEKISMQSFKE